MMVPHPNQQAPYGPQPYTLHAPGARAACLLVHGFTGSPLELRPLAEHLSANGIHVDAPLLPGHGTCPEDLNHVTWRDWMETVEAAYLELRDTAPHVFAAGLSLGSLLVAELAKRQPELTGIILCSPALTIANKLIALTPLARYLIRTVPKQNSDHPTAPDAQRYLWSYDRWTVAGAAELLRLKQRVRRGLEQIRVPALVIYSVRDKMIGENAAADTYERLGSKNKELVELEESGHVLTVDVERERVFAAAVRFIAEHAGS